MRCFFAVPIPPDIAENLGICGNEAYTRLKGGGIRTKPVGAGNFHITLRFLGEINPKVVGTLEQRLSGVVSETEPFDIAITGTGCFPKASHPKVVWAGVGEGAGSLVRLHGVVEAALDGIGAAEDTQRYHPHITLLRSDGSAPSPGFFAWMNENAGRVMGKFRPAALELYRSDLQPSGPVYRSVLKLPFKNRA